MVNDYFRYEETMRAMADEQFYRQMREASALLQTGGSEQAKAAAQIVERLYELHPENPDVALNLGAAYILSKQYKRAIPVLEAMTQVVENAAVWANLAAAYLGTLQISTPEKQDKAIAAYNRALEIDPYHPNAHYNLGLIYQDRGDWANARDSFLGALRTNPLDNDARVLLAKAERLLDEERSA
ncbi:MAG: tetratricopeptide repeat protein [Anaerolineae bacterium]|nr:tetratricopeptide repeat protein [Anaerolineae bacterium]